MQDTAIETIEAAEQDRLELIAYVAKLEREVVNARRYLETCRQLVGAQEHEMLLDALRRQRTQRPERARVDQRATGRFWRLSER